MKILVTGGAGFIGSHVSEALIKHGHEVWVVDDLSTGNRSNVPDSAVFYEMDIRSEEFSQLVLSARPQAVVHLAAQIDVRKSVADPVLDADINVLGLIRLAKASANAGVSRIVFSSTGGAIYGEQEHFPAAEDHPCNPVSPYGTSKLCGEIYLDYFSRAGGPNCVSLRYSNVYGPRQDPHGEAGVVAIFAGRLLKGEPPRIYGDGTQTRDYVFVEDVVLANLLAIEREVQGVFNIGTGRETDVNTLANFMSSITGFQEKPEYYPPKPGEQMRSVIDAGKAGKILGWQPNVDLENGLEKTIAFFRDNLG